MYGWIWRHLPGPASAKVMQALVLFAVVAAALLFVVFPVVEPHLGFNQVTVAHR